MTQIRYRPRDASGVPLTGSGLAIEFTPMKRYADSAGEIVEKPRRVVLVSGAATTFDVPASPAGNAVRFVESFRGGRTWVKFVPSSGGVVDFESLANVDPATLSPVAAPEAAWWATAATATAKADSAFALASVTQAPAPTGNAVTDTANFLAALLTAQASGGTLQLQAGAYNIPNGVATNRSATQPRIVGRGQKRTTVNGTITLNGVSGGFCGGYLADFMWTGTLTGPCLEIVGCTDVRWDRLGFFANAPVGILLHNKSAGDYTELCRGHANFGTECTTAIEYRVTAGDGSFHGSGLTGGSTINQKSGATAPNILVGANALPYNAPMDIKVWTRSTTQPVIRHNGLITSNFQGYITVESFTGSTCILVDHASTAPLTFVGGLSTFGGSVGGVDIGYLRVTSQVAITGTSTVTTPPDPAPLIGTMTNVRSPITTDGSLIASLLNPVDASAGQRVMTLPSAATAGRPLVVSKVDASANKVVVSGSISGVVTTVDLLAQGDSLTLLSNGGSWYPITTRPRPVPTAAPDGVAAAMVSGCYYRPQGSTLTTVQAADGQARGGLLVCGAAATLTEIGVEVTAAGSAGSVYRLAIYKLPVGASNSAALLLDAGTVDATTTGYKSLTISQAVAAGDKLLLVGVPQGAPATAPTVRANGGDVAYFGATGATSVTASQIVGSLANGVPGAAPASHNVTGAGTVPRVVVKAA